MIPGTRLRVRRGDTLELVIGPVVDNEGTVQDITGSTIRFTAKHRYSDADGAAVLAGSTPGWVTITDGPGGKALLRVPAASMAPLDPASVLVWDIQISQTGGVVKTLASGTLIVDPDVTVAT